MISAPKTDINIRDCRWTDTKPGKVMGKAISMALLEVKAD